MTESEALKLLERYSGCIKQIFAEFKLNVVKISLVGWDSVWEYDLKKLANKI